MHKVRIIIFMREECFLGFNCSATKQQRKAFTLWCKYIRLITNINSKGQKAILNFSGKGFSSQFRFRFLTFLGQTLYVSTCCRAAMTLFFLAGDCGFPLFRITSSELLVPSCVKGTAVVLLPCEAQQLLTLSRVNSISPKISKQFWALLMRIIRIRCWYAQKGWPFWGSSIINHPCNFP